MAKIYEYKDSMLGLIHKKKRRIFAYLRQNQIRRIKVLILTLLIIISNYNVFAIENTNITYGKYSIKSEQDPFMYIKYNNVMQPNYMYSYILNGKENIAYCLDRGMTGPELVEDYLVDTTDKITDDKLRLILLNSYPYKSAQELGLMSIEQAKFASQFAIWCYTSNVNVERIEPISDLNLDIVEAIKKIYYSKDGNIEDYNINLGISDGRVQIEKENNNYYVTKTITINSNNILKYKVSTQDSNILIKKQEDKYKLYLPIDKIQNKYSVVLNIDYEAKENIALLGNKLDNNYQNMALMLNDTFSGSESYICNITLNTTNVIITKEDIDTKEKLSDVMYSITDENGIDYGTLTTNKDGKISIDVKYVDNTKLNIKEISAKEGYKNDSNIHTYSLCGEPNIDITLTNEKEKGIIKIIKKTKEYNEETKINENTPMENVEFFILDSNMNIVDKLVTNKYGQCQSKELPIGKYYIKETKTNFGYEILKELVEIEIIKDKDEIVAQILNNNAFVEKQLPVTGR